MKDNNLKRLVRRLLKINIKLDLTMNYPWIYISRINGKKVSETFHSEHGFTIGYAKDQDVTFTDIKQIFKLIKKYSNR